MTAAHIPAARTVAATIHVEMDTGDVYQVQVADPVVDVQLGWLVDPEARGAAPEMVRVFVQGRRLDDAADADGSSTRPEADATGPDSDDVKWVGAPPPMIRQD